MSDKPYTVIVSYLPTEKVEAFNEVFDQASGVLFLSGSSDPCLRICVGEIDIESTSYPYEDAKRYFIQAWHAIRLKMKALREKRGSAE